MNVKSMLITGANRGIGLEFVKQIVKLPEAPKWLFATCRNPEQATELRKIADTNSNVKLLKLEVTDAADIQSVVRTIEKELGDEGLNLLVNNAGYMDWSTQPLDAVNPETMMEHFKINTVAPLMICKAFLPLLRKAASKSIIEGMSVSKAAIVNLTSIVAALHDNTYGGMYAYGTSKTALNKVTRSLSIDLRRDGILAVMIHPGWAQTEMGGPNAMIAPEVSVTSVIKVIGGLNKEKNGAYLNYDGKSLPW